MAGSIDASGPVVIPAAASHIITADETDPQHSGNDGVAVHGIGVAVERVQPSPDDGGAEAPPSGGEGILLSQAELMELPTSGPGWDAIMARVEDPYGGSYILGERDDANKDVLAHALAGARLDNAAYKTFVRDNVERIMTEPRNDGDLLATLRQLQTYIISADLIDLASFDPELDARFRTWLADEIRFDYEGGGGGGSVVSNHNRKPNNYGTHAGATRVAAALYLGDEEELEAARDIWYGWATGDPDYSHETRRWTGTDWQCDPDRPAGINAAGCARDGNSIDGVLPEDQERCGEYSWPPCETNYIHGATDGMTLTFWMLAQQGEDAWAWGDQAALRQMEWKYANDQPPYDGFRWQIPVIEAAYGVDFPGNAPQATSTNFGFADWWAQNEGAPVPESRTDSAPAPDPEPPASSGPGLWLVAVIVVSGGLLLTLAILFIRRSRR
ncbi:alginate lyase [Blastococcus colisei]|uniref:Alginate lyase n=1 Tax=Blastococcus colisei TaxID=1564162 RepID=A0A543P193_9ACTN|nr:alginate lyase family protein [Blastococcus colisei]TQN37886.1 alginate lyase [Blastococcus colisei]